MRVVLTSLAVALVAALFLALVAPLLIDWSAHRAEIAARLSQLTGGEVTLDGPVAAKLLPTPFVELGEGSVAGAGPDAPRLTFASARLELGLVKLLGGTVRFTDIRLDRPVLALKRRADGSLDFPRPPTDRAIGFDRLVITDGKLLVAGSKGAPEREIDGVALTADAPSLAGPFHLAGSVAGPGGAPVVFRIATETLTDGRFPLRAAVDSGPNWPALEFDGAFDGASLAGNAALTDDAPGPPGETPWRAAGRLVADSSGAALNPAEFRFGPDERALRALGSAALVFGSPSRLSLDIKARQANLDGLLRRKGEDGAPPVRALSLFSSLLETSFESGRPLVIDARLSADQTILGGQTLPDLSGTLAARPGEPVRVAFDLGLPAQTRLKGDGRLETGPAAKFVGDVDASTGDFGLFRDWAGVGAPSFAAGASALVAALPYRQARFAGPVEVSGAGLSGQGVTIALDNSTLAGSVAFTAPAGSGPGRLFLDLTSPSLDMASPPNLAASAGLVSDLDLSLSLKADALHVADVSDGPVDSGSLSFKLTKTGPETRLDRLAVANLGGAAIEAQGALGAQGLSLTGHVRGDRLRDFALLLSRVAPNAWTRLAAERADLISPASLAFEGHGAPDGTVTAFSSKGSLGQTQIALSVEPGPRQSGQAIALTLDAPQLGALLRQFGLRAPAAANGPPAHVAINAAGDSAGGYDLNGAATLAGLDVSGRGRFLPEAQDDDARLFGSVRIAGANVSPLLAALGVAPAGGAIGPVEAGAELTLRGDAWTLSRFAATVAGVKAKGEFAYRPVPPDAGAALAVPDVARALEALGGAGPARGPGPAPEISGALSLDRLSFGNLVGVVLGPLAPPKTGGFWSDARFTAPPLNLPSASVKLSVGALDLMKGLAAENFTARLGLERGRLDLADISATFLGGTLSGRSALRRNGDSATLAGALSADALSIRRAGFSGEVGGTIEFASTGSSPAALIAGLAGTGSARFAHAELARGDIGALDRVVAGAQEPDAQLDETNIAFFFGKELDRAAARLPDGAAPIALSAGALKLGPVTLARPQGGEASVSATLDLRRFGVETRLALASPSDRLKFWSGPPPAASVTVRDALDAPKREVDVSALSAGLATQAIARETDRIANLEADIRERAFFNRRLKGLQAMDRREQELQDWRAEQERLKGLTQRLDAERAEEARIAAEKAAAEKVAAEKADAERKAKEKAEAEKAAAESAAVQPELPPELPVPEGGPPPSGPPGPPVRPGASGSDAPLSRPLPPSRPKNAAQQEREAPAVPVPGGLY